MSGKISAIAMNYAGKTDLSNRLSYSNGVKNIVGIQGVNLQMGLRILNSTDSSQLIYISPTKLIGLDVVDVKKNLTAVPSSFADNKGDLAMFKKVLQLNGLPAGISFACATYMPDDAVVTKKVTVASTNPNQDLSLLATSLNDTPIQIKGINMRSFDASGNPENSNYGNTISVHNINAYRPSKQAGLINLADYQSSKDVSTEILKIDLLKHNIVVGISQEDVIGLVVNPGTRLDITFNIGARDSRPERFHRDIKEGTQLLLNEFANVEPCNC